jgi:hypothetical protein
MAVWDPCSACSGAGALKCKDCKCHRCEASGTIKETCPKCSGSKKLSCDQCQGAGQLLKKKGWFSDTYETCWRCHGSKQQDCACHGGTVLVSCPACKGVKRNAQCSRCGSTGQLKCTSCGGSGKVPSEWYGSLAAMPVEKLKFEHEKRQRNIPMLETRLFGVQREHEELLDHGYSNEGYNDRARPLRSEIDRFVAEIRNLKGEMDAIEKAMESKWK